MRNAEQEFMLRRWKISTKKFIDNSTILQNKMSENSHESKVEMVISIVLKPVFVLNFGHLIFHSVLVTHTDTLWDGSGRTLPSRLRTSDFHRFRFFVFSFFRFFPFISSSECLSLTYFVLFLRGLLIFKLKSSPQYALFWHTWSCFKKIDHRSDQIRDQTQPWNSIEGQARN